MLHSLFPSSSFSLLPLVTRRAKHKLTPLQHYPSSPEDLEGPALKLSPGERDWGGHL